MTQEAVRVADVRMRAAFGWRRLAVLAAVVAAVSHLLIGAAYRDLDAIVVAVSFGVALGVMRLRRGTVGTGLLALAFANVAAWTVSATITNLGGRSGFTAVAVPGVIAVLSMAGLVAAVAALRTGRREGADGTAARRLLGAAAAGLVLVVGVAALGGDGAMVAQPDDLVLASGSTAFSETELVAPAGMVGTLRWWIDDAVAIT